MKRTWVVRAAVVVTLALVAGFAVMWPGYDVRNLPPEEASLWVLQTGEGKRYARVNTDLGELDTVKNVANPSGVAQYGDRVAVFADGNQRFAPVHQSQPESLGDDDEGTFIDTPADTVQMVTAGEWVATLTSQADAYRQRIGEEPVPVTVFEADEDEEDVSRNPVALGVATTGEVAVAVAEPGNIRVSVAGGDGAHEWTAPATGGGEFALAAIGEVWVLHDREAGQLWTSTSTDPVLTDLPEGALLQESTSQGDRVFLSDEGGFTSVMLDGEDVERFEGAQGTPAQPVTVEGTTHISWLSEGQGALWSSDAGLTPLTFPNEELGDSRQPVIVHNGSRALVNEQQSGWVWSIPDGEILPSSTQWRVDERVPEVTETTSTEKVHDPKPPIAEPDSFGVRAGQRALLPVLLNDHDPNEDVLTVVPGSVQGLDPDFGEVSLTNQNQQLVVDVRPDAEGTGTFTYRVSDGTTADGLQSEPAKVTLHVEPDKTNEAPQWCAVEGCLAEWPTLEVAPGGSTRVNVLEGWVDPEGDPIYLSGVEGNVDVGSLITKPDGQITYRHSGGDAAASMSVEVVVADAHGATATKPLDIVVKADPTLTLRPFAVTGVVGSPLSVDFSEYVTGASGGASLEALVPIDDGGADISVSRGGLSATVQANEAGSYLLQATVRDREQEVMEVVRVNIVDPAQAPITTGPLTAFVRPGEDETVDVVEAATDPLGEVLLVDNLEVDSEESASLDVQVVGQHLLRVSGGTEDGKPGRLGKAGYRLSDGTGQAERETEADLTVVLLPANEAVAPIAVDDRVTVKAGTQIDIPVLENDTAPAGAHIQIDQSSIVNEHEAGLVFATHDKLRYLAPDEPGDYTVTYSVGLLGFPTLTSTARVHIKVTGEEGAGAPLAPTLEGRVVSGQTVKIPFEAYPSENDGGVARLDRIMSQPEGGQAQVSAEGDAIEFSSNPDVTGQLSFEYRVRDDEGETSTGEVRVGVLDTSSVPGPITYSDYVQVQLGEEHTVSVTPTDNDVDPAGGELTVTEVLPNAEPGTEEYERLERRIVKQDLDEGWVHLSGGDTLGADSYMYTAENELGDTSVGMIVVKTVREPVMSMPIIQDTTLTVETIDELERGVNVLSKKITWNAGDHSELELSLWGDQEGFSVNGRSIRGKVQEEAQLVPFEVTGTSFQGTDVSGYGFLRVPGLSELKPSLRSAYREIVVNENERIDVDLRDAVRIPKGETLNVVADEVRASGAREAASCEMVKGYTLRYEAGEGSPWRDSCTIPVSYGSGEEPTLLHMRVKVEAANPEPELRSGTLTVRPGKTEQYNLEHLVEWDHESPRPDITPVTAYDGSLFDVEQQGTTLLVTGKDSAKPSRSEPVMVSLSQYPDLNPQPLTLVVGRAPSTLPKGASVAQECTQRGGDTSCSFEVIGGAGEVNPLPNTPLQLVSVSKARNCEGVQFAVDGERSVRASWREDQAGAADCRASFVVEDAQGRTSAGERNGQIMFDLMGTPANPTRLEWVGYGSTSVQLRAISERASIPEVTGYRVEGAGKTVECPASGVCDIRGLETGQPHEFRVTALNSVGASSGQARVTAWAYAAPDAPEHASWTPKANSGEGKTVTLNIEGIHPSTSSVILRGGAEERTFPVRGTRLTVDYEVGNSPRDISITPATKFDVPPEHVGGGSSTGKQLTLRGVHGVGAPKLKEPLQVNVEGRDLVVHAHAQNNGSNNIQYSFALDNESCDRWGSEGSQRFENVSRNVAHTVTVCARHIYENEAKFGVSTQTSESVTIAVPQPDQASYTISSPSQSSSKGTKTWEWNEVTTNAKTTDGHYLLFENEKGQKSKDIASVLQNADALDSVGKIFVRNCEKDDRGNETEVCSARSPVTPTGSDVLGAWVVIEKVADAEGICTAKDLSSLADFSKRPFDTNVSVVNHDEQRVKLQVKLPGLGTVTSDPCTPIE